MTRKNFYDMTDHERTDFHAALTTWAKKPENIVKTRITLEEVEKFEVLADAFFDAVLANAVEATRTHLTVADRDETRAATDEWLKHYFIPFIWENKKFVTNSDLEYFYHSRPVPAKPGHKPLPTASFDMIVKPKSNGVVEISLSSNELTIGLPNNAESAYIEFRVIGESEEWKPIGPQPYTDVRSDIRHQFPTHLIGKTIEMRGFWQNKNGHGLISQPVSVVLN